MKELESTINGLPVFKHVSGYTKYITCNNVTIPVYHLANIINVKRVFLNTYEVQNNDFVLKENLFSPDENPENGFICDNDELETLYREVK